MLEGLDKAYDSINKQLNKHNSKEQLIARAKQKLITGYESEFTTFYTNVKTQKGLVLYCDYNNFTGDKSFILEIPTIKIAFGQCVYTDIYEAPINIVNFLNCMDDCLVAIYNNILFYLQGCFIVGIDSKNCNILFIFWVDRLKIYEFSITKVSKYKLNFNFTFQDSTGYREGHSLVFDLRDYSLPLKSLKEIKRGSR